MKCPKCQFEQAEGGAECLRCGVLFARLAQAHDQEGGIYRPLAVEAVESAFSWKELLLEERADAEPARFWGRSVLLAVLVVWGWRFFTSSVARNYVGESFLHWVNLPFHEAGHLLFGFFGDFIQALGGTLGQLIVPAVCLGTFLLRNRDPFGASVALWWLAENFMDIAPYIADARSGELLLLGGVTGREAPGYHDWENILGDLGLLAYDQRLGSLSYAFGRLLMVAALVWGGWLLQRQWRELKAARSARDPDSR